jgi:hypothetical protein
LKPLIDACLRHSIHEFLLVTFVHQEQTVLQHKAEESTVLASQVIADTDTTYDEVATSADANSTAVEPETQQAGVNTESGTQQHIAQEAAVPTDNSTINIQQQQQQQQLSRAARRQQSNSSSGIPIHEMFANWTKSPWITAVGQVLVNIRYVATALCNTCWLYARVVMRVLYSILHSTLLHNECH